jgi:hypothetical protein
LLIVHLPDSQVPDLIVTDSDSDKRRDSFDVDTVEEPRSWLPTFQEIYNAKSAGVTNMSCGLPLRQPTVSVADLGLDEEQFLPPGEASRPTTVNPALLQVIPDVPDSEVVPQVILPERKRVASRDTGKESPPKRCVRLPGLGTLKLMPRREDK